MEKKSEREHQHIEYFNPDILSLEQSYQDFSFEMQLFDAGDGYENFNEFMNRDASEYKKDGNGVTYVVWNVKVDQSNNVIERDVVAYYTLAATAIPYVDRIRLNEEEVKIIKDEFDIEICGVSAVEIKMFAVDEKYQDVFWKYEGEDLPISAWVIRHIINYANSLLDEVIGFKALFYIPFRKRKCFTWRMGFIL